MGLWSRLKQYLFRLATARTPDGRGGTAGHRAGVDRSPVPVAAGAEARETFGVTPTDPILCDQPAGERAYILSLRCPAGHRLGGPRRGSMSGKCPHAAGHVELLVLPGMNPAEQCIVDCYDLRCEGGEYTCALYFDMYHPDPPPQPAPRGLTRV
jgi:hypothetical protein